MPGPVPKREEERRRRNKPDVAVEKINLDEVLAMEVEVPVADPDWDPIAIDFFESLKRSGQAIWMEPSDWQVARILAESLSRDLDEQVVGITESGEVVKSRIPLKGASLTAYLKGFASLMATEGDRRKLRIELERKKATDAALAGDGKVVPISQVREARFHAGEQR